MTFGLVILIILPKKHGYQYHDVLTSETIPTNFLPEVTWMCFHPYDLPCILETRP